MNYGRFLNMIPHRVEESGQDIVFTEAMVSSYCVANAELDSRWRDRKSEYGDKFAFMGEFVFCGSNKNLRSITFVAMLGALHTHSEREWFRFAEHLEGSKYRMDFP